MRTDNEELQENFESSEKKVKRLTSLNGEMRDLIEQERESNNEEVQNLEKMYQNINKSAESKGMVVKNKLLSLAGHFKVFVASSFNQE